MSPILPPHALEIISRSTEQTRRIGMRLGALLQVGDLVCLVGDLGTGKTTLVGGLAAGWGSLDQVSSPTFVLVNIYRRSDTVRLNHLDAYRLSGPAEAMELDLDEMLVHGPMVIEWADRIDGALQEDRFLVTMKMVDETQRHFLFSAHGARYKTLLGDFRNQVFGVS
ncbi:MAG: tRNA (adenosine(37)-N6)-threonylcarbamoyltransferase complex ATPase subunit type 1 TsaE [Chloroflexi bacterium]|nr:tRNA (adenosine(37)-N6)-threonylcarbamoyltransferase complex ATPase subunit type 1 TsaE [Chloroflexota bacterium]